MPQPIACLRGIKRPCEPHAGPSVIKITPLSDRTGRYLLDDPAREVADLFTRSSGGRWLGSAAVNFGLEGAVRAEALASVLAGAPPGGSWSPSPRRRRTAIGLTVAAPKSVSVLFASRDHEIARAVVQAHEASVRSAVGYLESRAVSVERSMADGSRQSLATDGIVAASFVHGVSRSGDPHLHSHVLIANFARDREGRFGALDQRGLRAHAHALDALYRAELRDRLRRGLSLRFERSAQSVDRIEGVPYALEVALSGRTAEIRGGEIARPHKRLLNRDEAEEIWRQRQDRAPEIDEPSRRSGSQHHLDEHVVGTHLLIPAPTARDAIVAWSESALGGIGASSLALSLDQLDVALGRGVHEHALAPRILQVSNLERRVLGPRPTDEVALKRWWSAGRSLRGDELAKRALSEFDRGGVHRAFADRGRG